MTPRMLTLLAPLAPLVLVACAQSTSVGAFELEVPSGWQTERDEGTLMVGERELAWTWAFTSQDARGLQEQEGGLTAASQQLARDFTADKAQEGSLEFGEPEELALGEGLVGISLTGAMAFEGVAMQLRVIVVIAEGNALVGVGVRTPNATPGDDAKSEKLLASIRAR